MSLPKTIADLEAKPESQIGPFLSGKAETKLRRCAGTGRCSQRGDPSLHRQHPHGQAFGAGHSQGAAHRGNGRVWLRQNDDGAGKPRTGAGSKDKRQRPPGTYPGDPRRGHRARQAHRRDAHRHQCALYRGDLRGVHDELRKLYARSPDARQKASRPAIFPTTRAVCAAPAATAPVR